MARRRTSAQRRAPADHRAHHRRRPQRCAQSSRRIRRQGFALVDQELEEGLRAVAVPIRDAEGTVVAAINLAVHAEPLDRSTRSARELLPRLLRDGRGAIEAATRATPTALGGRACEREPEPRRRTTSMRDADFVQSLERGLAVIRAFDGEHPALTLSDVAKATGLARAAARRFLLTLVELGYMRRRRTAVPPAVPRVLDLGRPYLSSLTLPELALPHLRASSSDVQESATVAVLDGSEIVYVAHVAGAADPLRLGRRRHARPRVRRPSLGRVLLAGQRDEWLDGAPRARSSCGAITAQDDHRRRGAFRDELDRVREQGYALVDQELEDGLRALAAPIRDGHDRVIAAVNVAVHASRWSLDAIRGELLPRLLETRRRDRAGRPRRRLSQPGALFRHSRTTPQPRCRRSRSRALKRTAAFATSGQTRRSTAPLRRRPRTTAGRGALPAVRAPGRRPPRRVVEAARVELVHDLAVRRRLDDLADRCTPPRTTCSSTAIQ